MRRAVSAILGSSIILGLCLCAPARAAWPPVFIQRHWPLQQVALSGVLKAVRDHARPSVMGISPPSEWPALHNLREDLVDLGRQRIDGYGDLPLALHFDVYKAVRLHLSDSDTTIGPRAAKKLALTQYRLSRVANLLEAPQNHHHVLMAEICGQDAIIEALQNISSETRQLVEAVAALRSEQIGWFSKDLQHRATIPAVMIAIPAIWAMLQPGVAGVVFTTGIGIGWGIGRSYQPYRQVADFRQTGHLANLMKPTSVAHYGMHRTYASPRYFNALVEHWTTGAELDIGALTRDTIAETHQRQARIDVEGFHGDAVKLPRDEGAYRLDLDYSFLFNPTADKGLEPTLLVMLHAEKTGARTWGRRDREQGPEDQVVIDLQPGPQPVRSQPGASATTANGDNVEVKIGEEVD